MTSLTNTQERNLSKKIITHTGELNLNGLIIDCYVLEDGTRVLSGRGMQVALNMVDSDDGTKTSGARLSRYLSQKSLKPFIYKDKEPGHFTPLECYIGKKKVSGYEATTLIDICDAFLTARKTIDLSSRQLIIAEQCEILVRSFAKVGIIALVDEATGYQYDREKDELQKILKKYISEELLPWQKRFPDIFYKELFRLNGWDFTVKGIKKRPGVVGRWTNTLIYSQLPKGVKDELISKTPISLSGHKTARLHQSLTSDIGHPHLSAQINQVLAIFTISDNMQEMWANFKKMNARKSGQLVMPFTFDQNGYTIETQSSCSLRIKAHRQKLHIRFYQIPRSCSLRIKAHRQKHTKA